jgi:transposase
VDGGLPRAEAVRLFRVSSATLKRWLRRRRVEGHVQPRPIPGPPARTGAALRAGLVPQLQAHPAATLEEHCCLWEQAHGVRVSPATMSRAISRHFGWTRKQGVWRPASGTRRPARPGATESAHSTRTGSSSSTSAAPTAA